MCVSVRQHVQDRRRKIPLRFKTIYNYNTAEVPGKTAACMCVSVCSFCLCMFACIVNPCKCRHVDRKHPFLATGWHEPKEKVYTLVKFAHRCNATHKHTLTPMNKYFQLKQVWGGGRGGGPRVHACKWPLGLKKFCLVTSLRRQLALKQMSKVVFFSLPLVCISF